MAEQEQPKKKMFEETKILGAVIGILVVLYVGITAYVMFTNQQFGSTQLKYSALHTAQLKELQGAVVSLSSTAAALRQDQQQWHTSVAEHLNRLDAALNQLSNTLS